MNNNFIRLDLLKPHNHLSSYKSFAFSLLNNKIKKSKKMRKTQHCCNQFTIFIFYNNKIYSFSFIFYKCTKTTTTIATKNQKFKINSKYQSKITLKFRLLTQTHVIEVLVVWEGSRPVMVLVSYFLHYVITSSSISYFIHAHTNIQISLNFFSNWFVDSKIWVCIFI